MERSDPTAEDSFAAILERSKFGIAMAAMIKMIATTISNSIREKPFCLSMPISFNLFGSRWGDTGKLGKGKPRSNLKRII
jgi:hypothetical protein